ncbi:MULTISPECIES: hypothetical protein [Streptomyces]|uniref:PCQ3_60 n=1 Tax=Streptomyces sp. W9 TaxID=682410 RepID=D0UZA9_9ACTN|nr:MULTISPECIES: hypothetical protein [Streptomyces]MYX88377.1 hypothetical protein [Streptomyces sp. SID4915]ACX85561.1 pCQ3_60 [Streptomyces sp. W9]MCX4444809.1 hypothetical protein [Streptomyces albidoflavus]WTC46180.1 hypothetical protein OH810_31565 [Streptomyces albidoflavus]SCE16174.1 hypothetical protein GA0115250_14473 [Streptomyces sp. BvitLS-983]
MAGEPSLGELGRLIQALREEQRENNMQVNARLDKLVSAEVYAVERAVMQKDITDLEKDVDAIRQQRQQDADRVTQTRRYLLASVVMPLLGLVLPVVLFLAGSK